MKKRLNGALALVAVAVAVLVACGGHDSSGSKSGVDASTDAALDAPAGACNFATFVQGLIANDTTMTALPSTDLGQACTDNQNQADFQSLFQ